ncbi:hypothetical protein OC844_005324 [Tilletia horrida]|nr:hypothetical protein OC844_005324 [Tilletia horrida]
MSSFVARALANFRASQPSPARLALRDIEALKVTNGKQVSAAAEGHGNIVSERDLTVGQIKNRAASKQPAAVGAGPASAPNAAQVPAQAAPATNQVPAQAQSVKAPPTAAAAPAAAPRADIATPKLHRGRDITVAEITDQASESEQAASQQAPQARLVNLEGTEADINAGPMAQSRDVTVAAIENESVPNAPVSRDVTLASITDNATEADEQAEDTSVPAAAPVTPAAAAPNPAPSTLPKGSKTETTAAGKVHPHSRAFSLTVVQASENDTDISEDAPATDSSASSSSPQQARAKVTVLHSSQGSQGDVSSSSKRDVTASGD